LICNINPLTEIMLVTRDMKMITSGTSFWTTSSPATSDIKFTQLPSVKKLYHSSSSVCFNVCVD